MANDVTVSSGSDGFRGRSFPDRDLSMIPGRYFRTVGDIPERRETALRDASRWHRSASGREDGKEEVNYEARRAVRGGITLLAVRLHFLDDVLHSVEMSPHPEDPDRSNLRFMADEFFTLFVHDPEGEEVREREIAGVQSRIAEVQARIAAPPPPGAAALLPGPVQKRPTTAELVQAVGRKEDIAGRAVAIAAQAEARMHFIKQGTEEIQGHAKVLANFYEEKANAALALVSDSIQLARDITEGLQTLSLYTGEGVSVENVLEGESADASEPLTLYQDRLYLDEELAVHSLVGGFDFSQLSSLGAILSDDPSLLDRMVPAKRGAVLVRVRREGREYFSDRSMAMADALLNERNFKVYLLVRDGGNVHLVNSEITTDAAERLFPTRKEIDDVFKVWGRHVTPEHLDYSKARSEFEKRTVFYKRMLLMLWGLDERLRLFGEFYDRAKFGNWYDGEFQSERIVYVHDAEGTLGVSRPGFREWMARQNAGLQAGSRVVALWNRMANPHSAPALYSYRSRSGEHERIYDPDETCSVAVVERRGDRLAVRCAASGRKRTDWNEVRKLEARIDLAKALADDSSACLCLDRVTVADLDYYLNSRRERLGYASYFHLFKEARKLLAAEEEAQAPVRAELARDMEHAGLGKEAAAEALDRAVCLWRAQGSGRLLGGPGWCPKEHNAVLDIAFALSGSLDDLVERARKDIPGIVPIEARMDGRGQLWLYREPKEDEKQPFERLLPQAMAVRTQVRVGRHGIRETGKIQRAYVANPAFAPRDVDSRRVPFSATREETVSADEELKASWAARSLPGYTAYEELEALAKAASRSATDALSKLDPAVLAAEAERVMDEDRTRWVANVEVIIPVGFFGMGGKGSDNIGFRMLALSGNAIEMIGSLDAGFAEKLVMSRYRTPEGRLERLRACLAGLTPGTFPLSLVHLGTDTARKAAVGVSVFNRSDSVEHTVDTHRWNVFGFASKEKPKPYASIRESLYSSLSRHSETKEDDLLLAWPLEENRVLAEGYFSMRQEKVSRT